MVVIDPNNGVRKVHTRVYTQRSLNQPPQISQELVLVRRGCWFECTFSLAHGMLAGAGRRQMVMDNGEQTKFIEALDPKIVL